MKSIIKKPAILLAFICISLLAKAQPGGGGPDPDPPVVGVPLDAGLSALLVAGIAYSAKRRYDKKKHDKAVENIEK